MNSEQPSALLETQLLALRRSLGIAQSRLAAALAASLDEALNVPALDSASAELRAAQTSLDEIVQHLPRVEPPPAMRACPACGKRIRVMATLCEYCWTRSTAP